MSFVQIGFLGALAAIAIPIVVHLVFRQRAKRVELGTLRFLQIVLEHTARRRRVMRWLLLALRLSCVVFLALLFARPYLLAARQEGEKQTVAILIDCSATMELKHEGIRAVEHALSTAQELLRTAPDNTRFEVALFDHTVHPLFEPTRTDNRETRRRDLSGPELASRLKAPEACHGATDYGAAIEWVRDVLAKAPPGPRRLHVFTDFQRSGLAWSDVDTLPEDVVTQLHDLGRAAVNNVAVTEARAERAWLRPGEQTSLHVTIYNGGPFTVADLPIVLKLTNDNRKIELREQAKLEPSSFESMRFDLPSLADGLWQGSISVKTDDDLPRDNSRHMALLASRPYQVLLVDGRGTTSPVLASTYFLEAALRLAPPGELYSASPFEPRHVGASEVLPNLDKFDVVVLSDVGDLDRRQVQKIADFVQRGGGLLVFCGENVTAERSRSLETAALTVGKIAGVAHALDLPWRLRSWDSKHPIFSAFSDPQLGDLQRLSFSACTSIQPAKEAVVLASFGEGKPAAIERRLGKGSIVWFTSTCDRQWSDWTVSQLYLPLMYQLLGYQSGLTAGGKVRQQVLEGPAVLPDSSQPGIQIREGYTLVVNGSPRESETDRCSLEEFVNRFGLKMAAVSTMPEVASHQRASIGTELIDNEIWPWLATLLLATVLIEGLIANRTAA